VLAAQGQRVSEGSPTQRHCLAIAEGYARLADQIEAQGRAGEANENSPRPPLSRAVTQGLAAMHVHTRDELNSMTDTQYKTLENLLRRMLRRRGHSLVKSRIKDARNLGHGGYMIAKTTLSGTGGLEAGEPVAGHTGWGFTLGLDDVERWLDAP
jgi:hypothetical protein